jgi:hypothetical protein
LISNSNSISQIQTPKFSPFKSTDQKTTPSIQISATTPEEEAESSSLTASQLSSSENTGKKNNKLSLLRNISFPKGFPQETQNSPKSPKAQKDFSFIFPFLNHKEHKSDQHGNSKRSGPSI